MEQFFQQFIEQFQLIGIFLTLLACGLGLPMPEDIVLFYGGYHVWKGSITLVNTIVVAMVGVLAGDSIIFFFGGRVGKRLRASGGGEGVASITRQQAGFFGRFLTPERMNKIWNWFGKYGNKVVFFGRFAAGMRAPLFFSAGLSGMSYARFIFYDGMAALISVPALIYLSYYFGEHIDRARELLLTSKKWAAGAIALFLLIYGLRWWWKRRKARQAAENTPVSG
ncbi:MAG: hypothetical protein GMKNLPBB_00479 [Myxococcota bacterium]|nr:hypothetical protein [Myxococcota bacterium]